jgi:hypothetical protein
VGVFFPPSGLTPPEPHGEYGDGWCRLFADVERNAVLAPRSLSRHRTAWLGALVAVAALAVPSGAVAATKPFSLVVSPSSVPAGTVASMSLTLTNRTSQQMLGSADVTVPTGLTVQSVSIPAPAGASVSGSTIRLRNLSVPPGASATATAQVAVPCAAAGTLTWGIVAKQANDFNGTPGNNLTLDPSTSSVTTTVSGACSLRFAAQPQDARVDEHITAADFDPSGPPVQVEVVDGSGARVTSSTASIAMSVTGGAGTAHLAGTTPVAAVAGVASFADLSVDAAGTYRLRASSPGIASASSDQFVVQQVAVECFEDVDCNAEASTQRSTVDATAFANGGIDAGFLQLSLDTGFRPDCAGYDEYSADWASVIGPDRSKLITFAIAKQVMNASPNNGASFLQMCFAAPFRFAPRPGSTLQELDLDAVPGADTFVALLPDCGAPPCVSARHKDNAGRGIIEAKAPGGTDDPAYRP